MEGRTVSEIWTDFIKTLRELVRGAYSSCPTKKGRKEKSEETIKADTEKDQEKKSGRKKL